MPKFKYTKQHNNYDLILGKTYKGIKYKPGWILINNDEGQSFLCRAECFVTEEVESCEK